MSKSESLAVPALRVQSSNAAPVRSDGDFVLYWMIANRRLSSNFALQRAVEWAVKLGKPLVIFEPLRSGYRWASDRLHQFVIDGMQDNQTRIAALQNRSIVYWPYVEARTDEGKGLLVGLAQRACVVVTDEFPCFFLPKMVAAAASRLPVRLEAVDSNGLLPLRATERVFTTAFSFRAYLQKELPPYLSQMPIAEPLRHCRGLPELSLSDVLRTSGSQATAAGQLDAINLASLPIDHSVGVVAQRGGTTVARQRLRAFFEQHLSNYCTGANEPDEDARSGLSPFLHFGHISAHELFADLMKREQWSPERLGSKTGGKREGWWGVDTGAEAWLDEFITWRELGYNLSSHSDDFDQYDSLPQWAQATLAKHEYDPREYQYSLAEFEQAATHDDLWNAAQTQLLREGKIHNYLRMLWGKKILEWSASPREALAVMIELNNRYALDGRNPNSYSGIFWVLGRYDRAWGPERPIFGNIRYMSSDSTRRKLNVKQYLQRYGKPARSRAPTLFDSDDD